MPTERPSSATEPSPSPSEDPAPRTRLCDELLNLEVAELPAWMLEDVFLRFPDPVTPADWACLDGHEELQRLVERRGDERGWGAPDAGVP